MLHAAIEAGVERVVCLSTDKAAYPINAMGISKANDGACYHCQRACQRTSAAARSSAAPVTAT